MNDVHKNDIGTVFELTIVDQDDEIVDISSATTKTIRFQRPDGSVLTKDASLVNTGTDGKMKYVTVTGDLNRVGLWQVQGFVAIGAGSWSSDLVQFIVLGNLE